MVENEVCKNFALKSCNKVELVIFLENCLYLCSMVTLKKKVYTSSFWLECKRGKIFPISPTLQCKQNVAFNKFKWVWKLSYVSSPFVAQNWGYITPKAIIISCCGKQHSSSKIKLQTTPSHSSFTLLMAWFKISLVTCYFSPPPSTWDW
jgi:hypothetical protein